MGSAGDSPAPVGDPPTGTAQIHVANRPFSLPRTVVSVPSGGSPDDTGGSPVLPGNQFPNTLLGNPDSEPQDARRPAGPLVGPPLSHLLCHILVRMGTTMACRAETRMLAMETGVE